MLFLLYVVGVVVTLLWYLLSWFRLCLLLRQGTPVPADVQEQIERIGKTYACKTCRAIELPGLPSPMVCGVFRPVLALPKGKALDDHVILHELLHLNYKDALQNVFWCFCRALHWCNPIVRLLLNRVGNDMESLCDQRVLERLHGEDRRNYGISLLGATNPSAPVYAGGRRVVFGLIFPRVCFLSPARTGAHSSGGGSWGSPRPSLLPGRRSPFP